MEQQQCTICMEEISNDHITPLPCLHIFHGNCIAMWTATSGSGLCPVCRHPMDVVDEVVDLEPSRPAGNRPSRAVEPHGFQSVAGEPWIPLRNNTRLSYWSTRLSQWLIGDRPARPLRLQWDKHLMFASSLMVVCLLCCFLTEQLIKPVVEFFFRVLIMLSCMSYLLLR